MTEPELRAQVMLDAGVLENPFYQGTRVTQMLNHAQDWLQLKLMKQGFRNWQKEATLTLANDTLQGLNTTKGDQPSDRLYDMPYEQIMTGVGLTPPTSVKPLDMVETKNLFEIANNAVLAPTTANPVYTEVGKEIHIYPRGTTSAPAVYSVKVTDLVKDAATESEIPLESQAILIERVVMQIKSSLGDEQTKQVKSAEIDKELSTKYQLDALKEKDDKGTTQ